MRKTGYSSWRFFSSNICSRALLPFGALLFSCLKDILESSPQSSSTQRWLSVGLSLSFFYTLYIQVLKRDTSRFSRGNLWGMGFIWAVLAIVVHLSVLYGIYNMDLGLVLKSYGFSPLRPWPFALLGLFLSPRLAAMVSKKWFF